MNHTPDDVKPLTAEEKRQYVRAQQQQQDEAETNRKLDAEYQRALLVARFKKELGAEGEHFAVLDMTHVGEGFFVVKLAPSIVWKTYWESKMTTVDEHDLVSACIVHPDRDTYLAARGRRQGIDVELGKLVGRLNGLRIGVDQGK